MAQACTVAPLALLLKADSMSASSHDHVCRRLTRPSSRRPLRSAGVRPRSARVNRGNVLLVEALLMLDKNTKSEIRGEIWDRHSHESRLVAVASGEDPVLAGAA